MSSVTSPVLVTGALGQLGAAFLAHLPPGRVVGVDIDTLDITREADVAAFVRDMRPSLIINCAAFNDVDGAELSPGRAALVNTEAVWTLARAAREVGATLVHYSTDFVFDGASDTPYVEEDTPRRSPCTGPRSGWGNRLPPRSNTTTCCGCRASTADTLGRPA
jgi:dTDP-4-dehydrorhamnose reductase